MTRDAAVSALVRATIFITTGPEMDFQHWPVTGE